MIVFPDIEGGSILVSDLHMHSLFLDGHVWPRTRVEEAFRDGLDVIAFTEHLEWQPHLADILHPDRNRARWMREALFAGHTVVYCKDWLMGRKNQLERLMPALIEVIDVRCPKSVGVVQLTLANHGDLPLTLELASDMRFLNVADWITIPAQGETVVGLKMGKRMRRVDVDVRVRNALVGPRTPFEMTLSISPKRS